MNLKSGRFLPEMTRPNMDNNNSSNPSHNNAQNIVEKPVVSTIKNTTVLSPFRISTATASTTTVFPISSQEALPPPPPGSSPLNLVISRPIFGNPGLPFQPILSRPKGNIDYIYGIPTMMTCL